MPANSTNSFYSSQLSKQKKKSVWRPESSQVYMLENVGDLCTKFGYWKSEFESRLVRKDV